MSQLEVDKIIPQSGTTLTIGDSGDTITFADGAVLGIDTDTLYIDSTNNRVGIGTSSPTQKLDIDTGHINFSNSYGIEWGGNNSVRGSASTNIINFRTNGAEAMRIDSNGNVGIGTSTPQGELHIKADTPSLYIQSDDGESCDIIFGDVSDQSRGRIRYDDSDNMIFQTNNLSEKMRIDSSGNVGIGTTSPANKLHVQNAGGGSGGYLKVTDAVHGGDVRFGMADGVNNDAVAGTFTGNNFLFFTNNTERMRIADSGNLLVGCTSVPNVGVSGQYGTTSSSTEVVISKNTSGTNPALYIRTSGGASKTAIIFYNDTTPVGSITTTTSSTAYNTSSDYRLKENVVDITGATERLKQLQPKRFNFIANADTTVDGFLAHEVSDIVPEAITGTKDEVDADGNPVYQNIDHSKLVPLLTSALQEAIAKIETLEVRLNALES